METFDREGRPIYLLKTNSNPDAWSGCYSDILWGGGWFVVYDGILAKAK